MSCILLSILAVSYRQAWISPGFQCTDSTLQQTFISVCLSNECVKNWLVMAPYALLFEVTHIHLYFSLQFTLEDIVINNFWTGKLWFWPRTSSYPAGRHLKETSRQLIYHTTNLYNKQQECRNVFCHWRLYLRVTEKYQNMKEVTEKKKKQEHACAKIYRCLNYFL